MPLTYIVILVAPLAVWLLLYAASEYEFRKRAAHDFRCTCASDPGGYCWECGE